MAVKRPSTSRLLTEGVLLAQVLLIGFVALSAVWYLGSWSRAPRWQEAWRHAHTPWIAIERWIHFRFIHYDAQYWVAPVRMDKGPLVIEGEPPAATYWSLTWYEGTRVHESVSSETVQLDEQGRYRITVGGEGSNALPLPPDAGRAVLYLRVYEPADSWPTPLPDVYQGGERVIAGGAL